MFKYKEYEYIIIRYKDDKLKLAKINGFKNVPCAIRGIYKNTKSSRKTGEIMDFHHSCILKILKQMGVEIEKHGWPNKKQ